jgi:hypothetical protein
MNEQTKQALSDFVQKMIAAAEQGAAFTAEQTPLLVQEWLRWQLVEASFWAVICIGAAVLSIAYWKKMWRLSEDEGFPYIAVNAIGSFSTVPGLVYTIYALKVWVAPRVVVFEEFLKILK